jgi:hypothetical protein
MDASTLFRLLRIATEKGMFPWEKLRNGDYLACIRMDVQITLSASCVAIRDEYENLMAEFAGNADPAGFQRLRGVATGKRDEALRAVWARLCELAGEASE